MEIVRERLEREYDLDLITTAPSVAYLAHRTDGSQVEVRSPHDMPAPAELDSVDEPIVEVMIITPTEYIGTVMEMVQQRRGEMGDMTYLSPERAELHYRLPLAEMVFDFFDHLKSKTKGYASLDYEPAGYQASDLVRVDILLNAQPVDAFSTIVHRDKAYPYGKAMVERLKELIPRQLFDVPVQAAVGSRIISRETIKAKRKDVTAKCYGGDITRKRKLLERQKKGKRRMKMVGSVEVPQEAFVAALRLEE
jgi:GTP-binding protein LepA